MAETSDTQRIPMTCALEQYTGALVGRHILLAEDSPDQQRLFATLMQNSGARVTLECNGEAAVEATSLDKTTFDAIIMDFAMPVMDGVEATRQLRSNGYQGPIIAITAHGSEISEDAWLSAGADAFLRKPFGFANLVTTVQQLTQSPTP